LQDYDNSINDFNNIKDEYNKMVDEWQFKKWKQKFKGKKF
jgi:hypothetical protein